MLPKIAAKHSGSVQNKQDLPENNLFMALLPYFFNGIRTIIALVLAFQSTVLVIKTDYDGVLFCLTHCNNARVWKSLIQLKGTAVPFRLLPVKQLIVMPSRCVGVWHASFLWRY